MRVKICGIRTVEAAIIACDSGADFLGFNFVSSSKRYIDSSAAKKIIDKIRGKIKIVGVFQNEQVETVNKIADLLGLDFVQMHGNEDNIYISQVKFPVIKSFTLLDNPQKIDVQYLLLDRVDREGALVDLQKAAEIAQEFPLFFAGGLTSENVSDIVCKVRPYGVDVAGGVETNGKQDIKKIRLFIERVKAL